MIERERLQELIEKEETLWCVSELWGGNKIKLHNKDVSDSDCFHISKTLLLSDSIEFYDEEETYRVPFQLLFETQQEYLNYKEEAEWIAKMHAERTEKFEPPLFKNLPYEYSFKFIRKGIEHELFCKRDSYIVVISCCKDYMSGTDDMEYNEENYTKAVEYARNLFLGKEK